MELDGACVRNLNDKKIKGKHWVSIFTDKNTTVYFCSLGIEYNSKEVLKEIKDKSNTRNVFRVQDNYSIMCGFLLLSRNLCLQEKLC